MHTELRAECFDPLAELKAYQDSQLLPGRYGATGIFIGTMRDFNADTHIASLFLEHYPGMTERYLSQIGKQASEKWALLDGLVLHRTGQIDIADAIVLVAIWAGHRGGCAGCLSVYY